MDYSVFDPYLRVETWHTSHDEDEARFYRCLRDALSRPDFNPDAMGKYMRSQKGTQFDDHIGDLVSKAWTVKDYLKATR